MDFLEQIQNDIKNKDIQQKLLAAKISVSEPRLTQYLKGDVKMKFFQFFLLIQKVYEDEIIIDKYLHEFIEQTTKAENIKECLEWSFQNGNTSLFEIALEKADKETSQVYTLLFLRKRKKIEAEELFERAETLKSGRIKQDDMKMLLQIISLYAQYDLKKYSTITLYTNLILNQIGIQKKSYILSSIWIRAKELAAIAYLKGGQVERAREVAHTLLKECNEQLFPLPITSMLSLLAESYLFTDGKKSSEYIERAISIFQGLGMKKYVYREHSLKATHDFIKIHNEDYTNLYLTDRAEKAHYHAKQKEKEHKQKALLILGEIESAGPLSPHQTYYKSLATGRLEDYEFSRNTFYANGDLFYTQLFN